MIPRIALAWWVSAGSRGQLLKAALGAVLAVAITVALCSLGTGARQAIEAELLGEGHSVRVRPPSFGIGPLESSWFMSRAALPGSIAFKANSAWAGSSSKSSSPANTAAIQRSACSLIVNQRP